MKIVSIKGGEIDCNLPHCTAAPAHGSQRLPFKQPLLTGSWDDPWQDAPEDHGSQCNVTHLLHYNVL